MAEVQHCRHETYNDAAPNTRRKSKNTTQKNLNLISQQQK